VVLAGAGCHGCRGDHPYVPYTIGAADAAPLLLAESAPTASVLPAPPDAGAFEERAATLAPDAQTSHWPVDGALLDAPAGEVFACAIVRDFDGDGALDAFAITHPPGGNDPGQLVYYRGASAAPPATALSPAATLPPAVPLARDPACAPVDRLALVGPATVLVELGARCVQAEAIAPDRYLAIASPAAGREIAVRLAATISDPPGAPDLSVDANVADRDGDGRPDVELRVTLEGGGPPLEPGPRVSATLGWLDRSAGLSRDAAATEASFRSLASLASLRAVRLKDAAAVPRFVQQVRALWRAACADGALPRLVGIRGTSAIPCGAARALEELGLAEVRACVTVGDPLRAALALDRAESPPAARTAPRAIEAQSWVAQIAPVATARPVRGIAAVPLLAQGHEVSWGALAFEPSGKLLVRTRAGVVRVDPDTGDEAAADGVPEWKAGVTSPDGVMRWIEAYDPCDGVALRATFASGDDMRDVALPVLPPLADRCGGSRGAPGRVLPLAWGTGGLQAIVEGEPILVSADLARAFPLGSFVDQPFARGAPRSPDGRVLVVPSAAGLLVRAGSQARLFRAPGLDGIYGEQRDCAVSNDAAHVACVHGTRAWVGAWELP